MLPFTSCIIEKEKTVTYGAISRTAPAYTELTFMWEMLHTTAN